MALRIPREKNPLDHNTQGVTWRVLEILYPGHTIFRVSDTLYSGRHLIWVSDTLKIQEKGLELIHGVITYGVRHQHTWGLLRVSPKVSDTKSN